MFKVLRDVFARLNVNFFGPVFGVQFTKQNHTRPSTLKALEVFGNNPIRVIEIGCYTGINAKNILSILNVKEFVVIDPYEKYDEFPDYNISLLAKAEKIALKRLQSSNTKITWVKEYSNDAIPFLNDKYDFIYIDGNHEFDFAYQDMVNYYQLLSPGGVMGGHDISDSGVHKALFKFLKDYDIQNFGIKEPDWYIQKTSI
ncbi:MAG: class I SAM-dependent methyltransferase [Sediminibacterium sp.]|uniref:class I SAM-dependent methyltransferase n=1 Tax=Sediminibacterium sp. TaxID=1917865 RepID=UPI00271A322F|nr:class I SAM-dependent methyltransferase [Sediminibacterium sp.]MDO8997140.1 class I SAM-dependent methyltransferase [Sediminibacterium sp.]